MVPKEKEYEEELQTEVIEAETTSDGNFLGSPRAERRHHARRVAQSRKPSNLQGAKKRKAIAPFRSESSRSPSRVLARSAKTPGGRYSRANQRNPRATHDEPSLQERSALQKGVQDDH